MSAPPASPRAPALSTHASIAEIGEREWERVSAERPLYLSHPWLRSVERHAAFEARYLALRGDGGRLLAALPAYLAPAPPPNAMYDPHAAVVRPALDAGAAAGELYPALLAGSRAAYANDVPVDPALGPAQEREAVAALLRACLAELGTGAGSVSLLYLTPAGLARVRPALPRQAPIVLSAADASLELRWDDFEGYLAAFAKRHRRKVRAELDAFARSGYEVAVEPLGPWCARFAPLLAATQARHGSDSDEERMREYLEALAAHLDERSLCFVCRDGSRVVGFSLFLRWGEAIYGRVVGFDYERLDPRAAAYFNLTYYEPIRWALAHGVRRVRWGLDSYDAKVRRGASLEPLCSVVVADPARMEGWREAAERWNADALARWRADFGRFPAALPEQAWGAVPCGGGEPGGRAGEPTATRRST